MLLYFCNVWFWVGPHKILALARWHGLLLRAPWLKSIFFCTIICDVILWFSKSHSSCKRYEFNGILDNCLKQSYALQKLKLSKDWWKIKDRENWGFDRSDIETQNKSTVLTWAKLEALYVNELVAMFWESFHCNCNWNCNWITITSTWIIVAVIENFKL